MSHLFAMAVVHFQLNCSWQNFPKGCIMTATAFLLSQPNYRKNWISLSDFWVTLAQLFSSYRSLSSQPLITICIILSDGQWKAGSFPGQGWDSEGVLCLQIFLRGSVLVGYGFCMCRTRIFLYKAFGDIELRDALMIAFSLLSLLSTGLKNNLKMPPCLFYTLNAKISFDYL